MKAAASMLYNGRSQTDFLLLFQSEGFEPQLEKAGNSAPIGGTSISYFPDAAKSHHSIRQDQLAVWQAGSHERGIVHCTETGDLVIFPTENSEPPASSFSEAVLLIQFR